MLALCGAAATALAGCSGSSGDEGTTRPATGTPTAAAAGDGGAPLSVRSVDAPAAVEIGQSYPVGFVVENPADASRTLRTPVSVRVGDEWRAFRRVEVQVPPGTTTVERAFASPRYLGTYRFRLDDPTAEWRVETTERRVAFGEPFTTPGGLSLAVLGGRFTDSYDEGGNSTVTPGSDRQFLLVRVRIENSTDGSVTLPPFGVFHVRTADTTYSVALDDPSQRIAVEPGHSSVIELPFVVPGSVSAGDVAVRWTPTYPSGRTVVVWRTG